MGRGPETSRARRWRTPRRDAAIAACRSLRAPPRKSAGADPVRSWRSSALPLPSRRPARRSPGGGGWGDVAVGRLRRLAFQRVVVHVLDDVLRQHDRRDAGVPDVLMLAAAGREKADLPRFVQPLENRMDRGEI